MAEQALLGCLTDEHQLGQLTDVGLCHGWAGLVHTARRAAADAATPGLAPAAATANSRMREYLRNHGPPADDSLLLGQAGVLLVDTTDHSAASSTPPRWDACLLVG
ncbi:lanthionine synthetase [Actinomycetes bacterium KLBMP 9797]